MYNVLFSDTLLSRYMYKKDFKELLLNLIGLEGRAVDRLTLTPELRLGNFYCSRITGTRERGYVVDGPLIKFLTLTYIACVKSQTCHHR